MDQSTPYDTRSDAPLDQVQLGQTLKASPSGQPKIQLNAQDKVTFDSLPSAEKQAWVLSQISYHQEYARMLCSLYNSGIPLHRDLPPEILMEIFANYHPTNNRDVRLLHVCSLWRRLLLRTAEFWVDMLRQPHHMGSREDLASSGGQCFKLSLDLSSPRDIFLTIPSFTKVSMEVLSPHLHRISFLDVNVSSAHLKYLFRLLRSETPRLETLNVRHVVHAQSRGLGREEWATLQSTQLQENSLSCLRNLMIPPALLQIAFLSGRDLQTLAISCSKDCPECGGPRSLVTRDAYWSFIRSCPALQQLSISGHCEPPFTQHSNESPPVPLRHLRKLVFGDIYPQWVSDLLHRLVIPVTTDIECKTAFDQRASIPVGISTLPVIAAVDRLSLEFYRQLGVNHQPGVNSFEARGWVGESVRLAVDATIEVDNAVAEVAKAFASTSVKDLRIWVSVRTLFNALHMGEHMVELLSGFPSITSLTVKRDRPDDLFRALACCTSGGAPICAGLETLTVHYKLDSGATAARFEYTCGIIESTLTRRASLGSRLKRFTYRCEGAERMGPGPVAEDIEARLTERFGKIVDEVVINVYMQLQKAGS